MKTLAILMSLMAIPQSFAIESEELQGKWKSCHHKEDFTFRSLSFEFNNNELLYKKELHQKNDCTDYPTNVEILKSQITYIENGRILIHAEDTLNDQILVIKEEGSALVFELLLPGIKAYLGRFYKEN